MWHLSLVPTTGTRRVRLDVSPYKSDAAVNVNLIVEAYC